MRYVHHLASWLIGASAVMAPVLAHAESSPVEASISYLGGVFGTWSLTNTSDSAFIQSVTINLAQKGSTSPGNLYFDTSFSAPGELLPFPFTPLTGASSTGFQTAVGAADGSTQLILNFSDFAPGELFSFELDVDHTRPTGFLNGLIDWGKKAMIKKFLVFNEIVLNHASTEIFGGSVGINLRRLNSRVTFY